MASKAYDYSMVVQNPFGAQKWSIHDRNNSGIKRTLTLKFKVTLVVMVVVLILVSAVIAVCFSLPTQVEDDVDNWMPNYISNSRLGKYKHAAISTCAAPCAAIGKDILEKNGSAVDAAIAALLCMGAVNPQSSGLGGGFLMLYYKKSEDHVYYIDSREVAPKKATKDMFGGNATLSELGPLSIAVPGELAGYVSVHDNHGILPWEDLFPPTIKMCEEGIRVNKHLANSLCKKKKEILARPNIRSVFMNNKTNKLYKEGDVYKRLDLAETLKTIAKEKRSAIYGQSELTDKLLEDLKAAGSIITREDFESYIPEIREPTSIKIRGNLTLYSASLPGSGPLLALMLNVLDGFDGVNANVGKSRNETVLLMQRFIETFKFAYAKRIFLSDDESDETLNLEKQLTKRSYADEIRKRIDDNYTHEPDYYGSNISIIEDHGTAHLSLVAPNGDAIAVTSTINQYFGSMVMSPQTGILFNDEMDDFASPGITNAFNVSGIGENYVVPGKRPISSMAPTIIVDENKDVRLVVGGNGGTQITSSVAQIIVRHLWLKQTVKEAIDAPRFHHQLIPNVLQYEFNFPEVLLRDLQGKGHELLKLGDKMVGIIMAVCKDEDGLLYANSDYRKRGEVDGF